MHICAWILDEVRTGVSLATSHMMLRVVRVRPMLRFIRVLSGKGHLAFGLRLSCRTAVDSPGEGHRRGDEPPSSPLVRALFLLYFRVVFSVKRRLYMTLHPSVSHWENSWWKYTECRNLNDCRDKVCVTVSQKRATALNSNLITYQVLSAAATANEWWVPF